MFEIEFPSDQAGRIWSKLTCPLIISPSRHFELTLRRTGSTQSYQAQPRNKVFCASNSVYFIDLYGNYGAQFLPR